MRIKQYELLLRESDSIVWKGKQKVHFTDSEEVYKFVVAEGLLALGSRPNEHLITIALNVKGEPLGYTISSIGELSATSLSPRSILMFCLEVNAAGCIIIHNHPSGDVSPSDEDILATHQLFEACKIMQIPLIDHLIVSNHSYTSLKAEGLLEA